MHESTSPEREEGCSIVVLCKMGQAEKARSVFRLAGFDTRYRDMPPAYRSQSLRRVPLAAFGACLRIPRGPQTDAHRASVCGPGCGIRTHGLLVPNQARYQTSLNPGGGIIIHASREKSKGEAGKDFGAERKILRWRRMTDRGCGAGQNSSSLTQRVLS